MGGKVAAFLAKTNTEDERCNARRNHGDAFDITVRR